MPTQTRPIPTIERDLARAQKASTKASEARAALPPGSSRARVTTANARWARAAEERDRLERELAEARAPAGTHEQLARSKKLRALTRAIDTLAPGKPPEAVLTWLDTLPETGPVGEPSWAALCLVAGVRRPSETTREQLRDEYRARVALTCRGCDAHLSADDGPYCPPCLYPDVFPEGPDWDDVADGEAV